jgi:hypothetical protein
MAPPEPTSQFPAGSQRRWPVDLGHKQEITGTSENLERPSGVIVDTIPSVSPQTPHLLLQDNEMLEPKHGCNNLVF